MKNDIVLWDVQGGPKKDFGSDVGYSDFEGV